MVPDSDSLSSKFDHYSSLHIDTAGRDVGAVAAGDPNKECTCLSIKPIIMFLLYLILNWARPVGSHDSR